MNQSGVSNRRDLTIAALVGLSAAVVLSLQILTLSQDEVSQFSKYPNAAIQWLNSTVSAERLTDYSPLYLWLHIAAFSLLEEPLRSLLMLHIILLSLTASLLFLILRRYSGMVISLAGAAAFVSGKSLIIYGYILEPEPLMIFFLAAIVFFAERKDMPGSLTAGISVALCLLTRPTFAPLLLIVPLYYWLHRINRRQFLGATAIFLAPVLMVLIFISFRNFSLQKSYSPLSMNAGPRFFDGNNPLAAGTRAAYPPLVTDVANRFVGESDYQYAVYRLFARKASGRDLPVAETDRFWVSKAANYIRDHPGHFLLMTAKRIFYLFHSYRWHDLDPSWLLDKALGRRSLTFMPFALLSALALTGLLLGAGSWRNYFLLYMIFLIQAGFLSIIYATDRQRVSLYPFFILFAAIALSKLKQGGLRKPLAVAVLLILTLLFSFDSDRMKDDLHIWEGTTQSDAFLEKAVQARTGMDYAGALKYSATSFALWPRSRDHVRLSELPGGSRGLAEAALEELSLVRRNSPSTELDKALLLIEAGQLDRAEAVLTALVKEGRTFLRDGDSLPEPLYHLGRIAFLRGQRALSAEFMLRALGRQPGDPDVLSQLACLTGDSLYTDKVFRYFDDIDALFFLGRACLETGSAEPALSYLTRLNSLLPDNPRIRIYLAAALSAAGRYREAAALYLATAGEDPGTVMLEEHILAAFRRWAGEGSAESLYWYGIVLRQYGHFPEALLTLQKASSLGYPGAAGALTELQGAMTP